MKASKLYTPLVFLALLAVPIAMLIGEKQSISMDEKRKLAEWPSFSWEDWTSGAYGAAIDDYFDDHLPVREVVMHWADGVKYAWGVHPVVAERKVVVKPAKREPLDTSKAGSDSARMNYLNDFDESYSGEMLIIDGAVYTQNSGNPAMSPSFAKMLNEYAEKLKGHTRVFSCVAPLSSAFIPVEKYAHLRQRNKSTLEAIRDNLQGPLFCDVMGEMLQKQNQKLFFGTDHHWTARGAYCGYVSFCKAAGFAPVKLEQMTRKVKTGFLGSLYSLTRDATVREHADTFEYFKPRIEASAVRFGESNLERPMKSSVFCESFRGSACYMTFICGDAPLIKITTGVKNGRKAAVVKNSMGNAFSVYLISHYEEIWVFDYRYSKHVMLDIIYDREIDDLIFALGMYGAMSNGTIHMMRKLGEGGVGMRPRRTESDSIQSDSLIPAPSQIPAAPNDSVIPLVPDVIDKIENDSNGE
ncbi:MAG: DHHW family protein [Bacteroidetes bacterium]|nr:DHHW family protein [Bacteroidota bacterium]MDA0943471.1 DHHW family protein [Bacteroidota bacterium]MDA1111983.1 DHHW family protein [Bacteroidota bacterium]